MPGAKSLLGWLERDPVNTGVSFSPIESPRPGAMGPVLDAIQAVLGNVIQVGDLVVAVAAWRAAKTNSAERPGIEFEVDGVKVGLDGDDPAKVRRVVKILGELLRAQDDGPGGPAIEE